MRALISRFLYSNLSFHAYICSKTMRILWQETTHHESNTSSSILCIHQQRLLRELSSTFPLLTFPRCRFALLLYFTRPPTHFPYAIFRCLRLYVLCFWRWREERYRWTNQKGNWKEQSESTDMRSLRWCGHWISLSGVIVLKIPFQGYPNALVISALLALHTWSISQQICSRDFARCWCLIHEVWSLFASS